MKSAKIIMTEQALIDLIGKEINGMGREVHGIKRRIETIERLIEGARDG